MAKVSVTTTKVERKPRAYMNTHTGNIVFPFGLSATSSVVVFDVTTQLIRHITPKWYEFDEDDMWVPIYDGDTLKIAFGESDDS